MLFATSLLIISFILLVYGVDMLVYRGRCCVKLLFERWLIYSCRSSAEWRLSGRSPSVPTSFVAELPLRADHRLGRLDGALLLVVTGHLCLFIVIISRLFLCEGSAPLTPKQLTKLPQDSNNTGAILWLMLAFIIMLISSRMVIDNASVLARHFG